MRPAPDGGRNVLHVLRCPVRTAGGSCAGRTAGCTSSAGCICPDTGSTGNASPGGCPGTGSAGKPCTGSASPRSCPGTGSAGKPCTGSCAGTGRTGSIRPGACASAGRGETCCACGIFRSLPEVRCSPNCRQPVLRPVRRKVSGDGAYLPEMRQRNSRRVPVLHPLRNGTAEGIRTRGSVPDAALTGLKLKKRRMK